MERGGVEDVWSLEKVMTLLKRFKAYQYPSIDCGRSERKGIMALLASRFGPIFVYGGNWVLCVLILLALAWVIYKLWKNQF